MKRVSYSDYFRKEESSEKGSSILLVKCQDGEWRDASQIRKNRSRLECELCGDEISGLRQGVLTPLAGRNPQSLDAGSYLCTKVKKIKYRIFCSHECAMIKLETTDARSSGFCTIGRN